MSAMTPRTYTGLKILLEHNPYHDAQGRFTTAGNAKVVTKSPGSGRVDIPEDALKSAEEGRVTTALFKDTRHEILRKAGHKQETIDEMEHLFNEWGIGGKSQEFARKTILNAVDKKTDLGKAIIDHSAMETKIWEKFVEGHPKRVENHVKEVLRDFDRGDYVTVAGNQYHKRDIADGIVSRESIAEWAALDLGKPGFLFRAGSLGGRMESWTTKSTGAVTNNLTGATFRGKLNKKHWDELKKEGYSILAGPTRMMGSPGESEITLIKLNP